MANHLFDTLLGEAEPKAVAIETGAGRYAYDEVALQSARFAAALAELGVKPGDRVAVQVEKSAAALFLYLAAVRAGAVYLPLNTGYTAAELEFFLSDAEPAVVVCDPARRGELAAIAGPARIETLDADGAGSLAVRAARQSGRQPAAARSAGELAAICYTSGTTGRSKGAMLTHGNLASNAAALKDIWRFTAADVLIHALPIYHVHGLFVATNVPLLAGGRIRLHPRFDPKAVLAALPGATSLMGVPTFYTRLLAEGGLTPEAVSDMRLFVSGSAPLLVQTHREWERRTGHRILERYGMTETGMIASNPYDGDRIAGTVGLPLPGVRLRVADRLTGTPLAAGGVGVVEVSGPNVFAGYWRAPEKTRSEFRADGYFITGDLGLIDPRGYLSIVGRDRDLVISGGLNVYPKEVEALLDALPGVVESAVVGLPHADLGEAVTAIVAVDADHPRDEAALMGALRAKIASFKRPKRILFTSELPRNAMGKVQKNVLRDAHRGLYDAES